MRRSTLWLALLIATVVVSVVAVRSVNGANIDKAKVKDRWAEMVSALRDGDQMRVRALMPPGFTGEVSHLMSPTFVRPITSKSKISVTGDRAYVCPEPKRHFWIIPGGNAVLLTKVNGEWFFTGKVSID